MAFRVLAEHILSYVPWKFPMNTKHSWSHEVIDPLSKLMSHDLAVAVNALGRKLAFTRSVILDFYAKTKCSSYA
jgi:hypothetical protein